MQVHKRAAVEKPGHPEQVAPIREFIGGGDSTNGRYKETQLSAHKENATKARENYNAVTAKTKKDWDEITKLTNLRTQSRSERERLASLKHCFTLMV